MPAELTYRLLPSVSEAPTTKRRQGGQVAIMSDFDLAKRWGMKFLVLHRTERTDGVLTKKRGIPRPF